MADADVGDVVVRQIQGSDPPALPKSFHYLEGGERDGGNRASTKSE